MVPDNRRGLIVPTVVTSIEDIVSQIKDPPDISLDYSVVEKGIDNYHVDVEISPVFTRQVREAVEQNLKLLVAGKPLISGNAGIMQEVRDTYTDLMKVTLHRCKTDLKPEQVSILQFGIVKFVIQEVLDALGTYGEKLEETLGQQK
jgi:predicted aldo/keto reductase-like oxidoreductase